jgi:PhnB protein
MKLNPHLAFDGRCETAFHFYEKCLGAQIVLMMRYDEVPTPMQLPPDWGKKIVHATLKVGDDQLTGADVPPESYQKPQGMSVLLHIPTSSEADRIFKTLAENGYVQLPLEETFWAQRFGILVDQFGISWMINCEKSL